MKIEFEFGVDLNTCLFGLAWQFDQFTKCDCGQCDFPLVKISGFRIFFLMFRFGLDKITEVRDGSKKVE